MAESQSGVHKCVVDNSDMLMRTRVKSKRTCMRVFQWHMIIDESIINVSSTHPVSRIHDASVPTSILFIDAVSFDIESSLVAPVSHYSA